MSVTIVCGTNELRSDSYTGRSIEEIRRELRTPMNLPPEGDVLLNGQRVSDLGALLRSGDEVEFVKSAGEKGAR